MPLYEYRCEVCGKNVEVIQKFSDPPVSECEDCGGPMERLLSPPSIQFKGAGWYVTDYAQKNGEKASSEKAPPEKSEKKTKSSSDESQSKTKKSTGSTQ